MTTPTAESPKLSDEVLAHLKQELTGHGATVSWNNVRREGNNIVGDIQLKWVEKLFGKDRTLIDVSKPFNFSGRDTIVEQRIHFDYLGVSVTINSHADVIENGPHTVCAEARAEWHGGSVGTDQNCHNF